MNSATKLNSIFYKLSKKKRSKLLGRGIGCGRGKTSGRGHKGQKARSGVSINGFEGGQQSIYTRLPKRGFNPVCRNICSVVNVGGVQRLIEAKRIVEGSIIDKEMLYKLGFIKSIKGKVKLLNKGKLSEKCVFHVDFVSEAAKKSVISVGGSVEVLS
ncbi:50S ribosomal protein L15 [Wolbachia endosymbiont of Dirofilaria (Dirofilaria) immitis]|uniref:50S ribosomal protein L15 n=1 Tax=Wolbachia endosymbiont of Dirofilaria (Dirofilaria) immitis TaxID=1812115 RepID=UPI00158CE0C3|nr:50S ribosomal protein L15 [Wolbachia endosymbiont of Dirofilaria (Dirofilaria) immitis]QKX02174.1 50S ribosomal protein L15 [Wolbachia endosymbiont of Dirofilaria (Dirofilaria) immitis]